MPHADDEGHEGRVGKRLGINVHDFTFDHIGHNIACANVRSGNESPLNLFEQFEHLSLLDRVHYTPCILCEQKESPSSDSPL
jgi:hypothetical protein